MTYHIGFTGSRNGMSNEQRATFEIALNDIFSDPQIAALHGAYQLHHGDCVGADSEAHDIWRRKVAHNISLLGSNGPFDGLITIHPPLDPKHRAFKDGDEILENRDYLDRDRDIVEVSQYLIGTPGSMKPKLRSGTWYTIKYAAKIHVEGSVILPDGMVVPVSDYA